MTCGDKCLHFYKKKDTTKDKNKTNYLPAHSLLL